MGDDVITLKAAWKIYDRWMEDSSVEFVPEPENLDRVFRRIAATFSQDFATKVVVDCYLLALANDLHATLLTFDRGLLRLAKLHGCSAATPSE
jgi:predicted nucleic acid-binding protein